MDGVTSLLVIEKMNVMSSWFPIIGQLPTYTSEKFISDLIAAFIVTVMLIPQSLAYAMLAGLPPHVGLYASVLPIIVYSLLGSSSVLAVGPVAIASIMTASALSSVTQTGLISHADGAITLALLSGGIMFVLGLLKFGFIANFLSHSVISGFITASGLLIALGQTKHVLGIELSGHTFYELITQLIVSIGQTNVTTAAIGIGTLLFLVAARKYGAAVFIALGFTPFVARSLTRMSLIVAVVASIVVVSTFNFDRHGVAIVGDIPAGIAMFGLPSLNIEVLKILIFPALFISIIGYVESISVGRTLGAKRDEKVDANQELLGLGSANLTSGLAGAFPVTGGFSRSVVNFDAGAQTQFAGIMAGIGISLASLFLTPYLYYLPIAMLAATIIVAVLTLVDLSILKQAWHFSKSDFIAVLLTILITLFAGVEAGVASGIVVSILLHLYHTSTPHIAEIGRLPGTSHFRNVNHFHVEKLDYVVALRIDESLLLSNTNFLESYILDVLVSRQPVRHIVLHCGAINTIDLTAMEMLEAINKRLKKRGVQLHLSEVKMPVKNLLEKADFVSSLNGRLFMSHLQAHEMLQNSI